MALQRYLDNIEARFIGPGLYPADIAEYQGFLDETALSSAFNILCAQHPALSGLIRRKHQRYQLYVGGDRAAQVRVVDGDENTLRQQMYSLGLRANVASELLHVRGIRKGHVALCASHAIFDYPSFGALFNQLWRYYTQIVNCEKISIEFTPALPVSAEKLVRERWYQHSSRDSAPPLQIRKRQHSGIFIERTVTLNEESTTRLADSAHAHETSIHGLVCGAILIALRSRGTTDEIAQMACHSAVNLRTRVSPRVGETETTVFQGLHRADVMVPANGNFITVGSEVKKQLAVDIRRRRLRLLHEAPNFELKTPLEKHLAQALISNWGSLPRLTQPSGLRITDRVKGQFSGWETSAICPTYVVSTYEGRLKIIGGYPSTYYSEDDVEKIVERITKQLLEL